MIKLHNFAILVQIGTNNGKDEFRELCRMYHPVKVILVEPLAIFRKDIEESYAGVPNVIIENVAITEVEKEEVTLVIPKGNLKVWGDQNFSLLPMDDWGSEFEEVKAPGMTFNQLCEKHDLKHIHFLMIDAEGFDCEIIKSINFNKVRIDKIMYEKWGFPVECFSRHGEKGKQYGIAGMKGAEEVLRRNGYNLLEEKTDIIATKYY